MVLTLILHLLSSSYSTGGLMLSTVGQGIINLLVPSAFLMGQLYGLNQSGHVQESSSIMW